MAFHDKFTGPLFTDTQSETATMPDTSTRTTCDTPHPTDKLRACNYDGPHGDTPHADGLGSWEHDGTSPDVYTRHLIVTLPSVSGEEADSIAEAIDVDVLTDGFTSHGTATAARGETVLAGGLPGTRLRQVDGVVYIIDGTSTATHSLTADEARQLAGALLTLAHKIDGK